MKPMALLLAAVAVCSFFGAVPFACSDIADLAPAQILCVEGGESGVLLCTDGGIAARGETLERAMIQLKNAAPGELLLATVDELVLVSYPPEAGAFLDAGLRPATSVYLAPALPESVDALAKYLHEQKDGVTLGMLADGVPRPVPRLVRGVNGLVVEVAS
ncbi:MAG: hypothetical protein IJT07_03795 [Oscillospiraceae bacterium]|nr:hypothetical protein [Oscillospiraceae bacterium]